MPKFKGQSSKRLSDAWQYMFELKTPVKKKGQKKTHVCAVCIWNFMTANPGEDVPWTEYLFGAAVEGKTYQSNTAMSHVNTHSTDDKNKWYRAFLNGGVGEVLGWSKGKELARRVSSAGLDSGGKPNKRQRKMQQTLEEVFSSSCSLNPTQPYTAQEIEAIRVKAVLAILNSPSTLPLDLFRQRGFIDLLAAVARQPGEDQGRYADIKLPSADYIKHAFSGMLRRYAHGLKKHLDRLHEEHWGLPFACADHDLWSGPDLTPVLGFGLHFRDSDFNMIHAPL